MLFIDYQTKLNSVQIRKPVLGVCLLAILDGFEAIINYKYILYIVYIHKSKANTVDF